MKLELLEIKCDNIFDDFDAVNNKKILTKNVCQRISILNFHYWIEFMLKSSLIINAHVSNTS